MGDPPPRGFRSPLSGDASPGRTQEDDPGHRGSGQTGDRWRPAGGTAEVPARSPDRWAVQASAPPPCVIRRYWWAKRLSKCLARDVHLDNLRWTVWNAGLFCVDEEIVPRRDFSHRSSGTRNLREARKPRNSGHRPPPGTRAISQKRELTHCTTDPLFYEITRLSSSRLS